MSNVSIEELFGELDPGSTAALQQYRGFARRLIGEGRLQSALDLIRGGLQHHPNDLELQYLRALTHSRAKQRQQAKACVEELVANVEHNLHTEADALSLAGKLCKERISMTLDAATQQDLARQAAGHYDRARQLQDTAFATINAATTWLLAGDLETARARAERALQQAESEYEHWKYATLGEAKLVLGEPAAALEFYQEAVQIAGPKVSDIASMRANVSLLKNHVDGVERILEVLKGGTVVLFSGHMLDHPQREEPPRFPNEQQLISAVSEEIDKKLTELNAVVGYCSAACGSDLLFARRMLERGAELHIVLPFAKEDFVTTSVDFGYDDKAFWRNEFEEVLAAAEVHYATEDRYLGHDVLFGFANTLVQGLALTHASRLGVDPVAVVVQDLEAQHQTGGATSFRETWTKGHHRLMCIDLANLRARAIPAATATSTLAAQPQRKVLRIEATRRIQTMLFADVKGFSKRPEEQVPVLTIQFMDLVADLLRQMSDPPEFANTWGDGLFVVFDEVTQGAEFALTMLEKVAKADWETLRDYDIRPGLRIGMHSGPVFRGRDSIIGRNNYFGHQVNLAARIEPITEVNCVYTSEQLAAALAVAPNHGFSCEYIGLTELAKGAGAIPLYHLQRK